MKAQEELNNILLAKLHNDENIKTRNLNITCQKLHLTNEREENWNFPVMRLKLSVRNHSNITHKKQRDSCESIGDNDPDLCRNAKKYTNNHRNKYVAEITLHFNNQRTETCLHTE